MGRIERRGRLNNLLPCIIFLPPGLCVLIANESRFLPEKNAEFSTEMNLPSFLYPSRNIIARVKLNRTSSVVRREKRAKERDSQARFIELCILTESLRLICLSN